MVLNYYLSLLFIFCAGIISISAHPISNQHCEEDEDEGEVASPVYGFVDLQELVKPNYWDVVVIGGGPAGVGAGCASRLIGKRVLVVSDSHAPLEEIAPGEGSPSGLFSKALRDAAKNLDVAVLQTLGLDRHVIWAQVKQNTAKLAAEGAHRGTYMMRDLGVQVIRGRGTIVSPTEVRIQPSYSPKDAVVTVSTNKIVVATGSRARQPNGIPFDDPRIFTSDTISELDALPQTVAISGSGIIAIEFAKVFSLFGCNVTMLVRGSDPPQRGLVRRAGMDLDVANELVRDLRAHGVQILTNVTVRDFQRIPAKNRQDRPIQMILSDGSILESDIFLAATGQVPNTIDLGLDQVGVALDHGGHLMVNDQLQTYVPTIYGAGDVLGAPALASTADVQGHAAVGHAFLSVAASTDADTSHKEDGADTNKSNLPWEGVTVLKAMMAALHNIRTIGYPVGVWTLPEVSYFGHTRESARQAGITDAKEAVASYSSCLRGRVFSNQGFLKLVYQQSTGQILGVHIIGEDACEMIHFGMQLVQDHRTVVEIMSQPFTAVTFHELYMWAARIAVLRDFAQTMIWQKLQAAHITSSSNGQVCSIPDHSTDGGDGNDNHDTRTTANSAVALQAIFQSMDSNQDEVLSGTELADALYSSGGVFGIVWTGMQLASVIIEPHDTDQSGDLSFSEFREMAATLDSD
jgi:NAD(P) transhydrogenase